MLPLVVRVHVFGRAGRGVRLCIPLFLMWLLLLPFALIVLPVLFVVCIVVDVDPFPALSAIWRVLCGLSGTNVEVDAPNASVFVHVL
jgi:hypothetical protein